MLTRRDLAELEALERFVATQPRSLYEFVPHVSPQFSAPYHLAPLADAFERAKRAARGEGPPVFVLSSTPPQHGKTELFLHGIANWVHAQPSDFLAYLSYNSEIAEGKSRFARDYALLAGVKLRDDTHSVKTWRTEAGGGLMARGLLGGAITGQSALKCLVIDDPYKSEADAISRVLNERTFTAFRTSVWSRLHRGTSVFVNHTRWHEHDLIGRIKSDPDLGPRFEHINLPAINDAGEPLWPEVMPLDLLELKRAGSTERQWWSLYMGSPRPAEGRLFDGVAYYDGYPPHVKVGIGVDLAYSAKTTADWNVAVVMGYASGVYYVLDVVRAQCTSTEWSRKLQSLAHQWPGAPMRIYAAGTELGSVDFFRRDGVPLKAVPARNDKLVRATPVASAWELGKVLVPRERSWVRSFLEVVQDFTGVGDMRDDEVDAMAAAYDILAGGAGTSVERIDSFNARQPVDLSGLSRGRGLGTW